MNLKLKLDYLEKMQMANCIENQNIKCEVNDYSFIKKLMTFLMLKIFIVGLLLMFLIWFLAINVEIKKEIHDVAIQAHELLTLCGDKLR